jgi:hypothetical protein
MPISAQEFVTGDKAKVMFGTNQAPGMKWTMNLKYNVKERNNSRDGIYRIRGIADADGTITIAYDDANEIFAYDAQTNPEWEPVIATLQLYVSETRFFSLAAIMDEVGITYEFNDAGDLEVKWKLQKSPIVFPVAPTP